jgi:hypothetical protein
MISVPEKSIGQVVCAHLRYAGWRLFIYRMWIWSDRLCEQRPRLDGLASKCKMRRIGHQECYSDDEACTNWTVSFLSRIHWAEIGHHYHISDPICSARSGKCVVGRCAAGEPRRWGPPRCSTSIASRAVTRFRQLLPAVRKSCSLLILSGAGLIISLVMELPCARN